MVRSCSFVMRLRTKAGEVLFKGNDKRTMWPIWKKWNVDISSGVQADGTSPYEVKDADGNLIYAGKAYADGAGDAVVQMNDLIAGRLYQELPSVATSGLKTGGRITETIEVEWGTAIAEEEAVTMDWSYDDAFSDVLLSSDPIRNEYDRRMPILATMRGAGALSTAFGGTTTAYTATDAQNFVFARQAAEGTLVITQGAKSVRYELRDTCRRYALYYVNAYGGWDALLMRRSATEEDTYSRDKHRVFVQSNDLPAQGRGTEVWRNTVTKRYTLHTDALTDAEAGRMHHLLGSTLAYLYDLERSLFIPVTIVTEACTYKTYINQGRQRVTYEVVAEVAMPIERR